MRPASVKRPLLSALLVLTLGACSNVASTNIKTAGIEAHLVVAADGTGKTKATAALNVDTSAVDFVKLSDGDSLVAKTGSQSQTLTESELLGAVSYAATFDGADAEGTAYTVSLNRATETSAPSSTVTLPAPFSITAPAPAASFSRANDDLAVTYASAGTHDSMSWSITGDCILNQSKVLDADTGSFTVAKASIKTPSSTTTENCQVTLTVSRTQVGTLDPAYQGGSILGVQTRTLTFTSTP